MDCTDDLGYQCVERWTNNLSKNAYRLLWEGNYNDGDVHDYAELTAETLSILVNKCVNVFEMNGVRKGTRLALYLPALIQMPIAALAAFRIGSPFLPICAMNEDVDQLVALLQTSACEVIITVDGFWSGTHLVRTKYILDDTLARLDNSCRRVVLIRHVTPNEGVPPPQRHIVAKRPHYLYKSCRRVVLIRHVTPNEGVPPPQRHIVAKRPHYLYKVNMQEGRDLWWSELFAQVSAQRQATTVDQNAPAMLHPVWSEKGVSLMSRSRDELRNEIEKWAQYIHPTGVCFVMCTQDACAAIVAMLAALCCSAQLLIFEGIASYPDCSRISQIINKYEVKTMIVSESDLLPVLQNEEYAHMWSTAALSKIIVIGTHAIAARASALFGVPSESIMPPWQHTDSSLK
ncbi:Acetyl-coenzyme A synthetase, cytoplasmic [Toxocara canis]|uniref:acetate--CoA ligase n=1 Tax=Toxocara canis TaxID=6265 RepID=A0A0B2URQ9_TOXCA|nr:Acetyl-coenzyme A synthetase, cytoplasmic [Toxocara canis]